MNFMEAYSRTIGKEKPQPAPAPAQTTPGLSTDDMKAYVDAKFDEMRNTISDEMKKFLSDNNVDSSQSKSTVETPEETPTPQADNIEKEGD